MILKEHLFWTSLSLIFFVQPTISQSSFSDSLYNVWKNESTSDSLRCDAFIGYTSQMLYNYPDSMEALLLSELERVEKTDQSVCQCNVIINLGMIQHHRGEILKSRAHFDEAYRLAIEHGLEREKMVYWNNIGTLELSTLDHEQAIKSFRKALKFAEGLDQAETHNTLHNIGICYSQLGNSKNAMEYYLLSLKERQAIKDTLSMLYSYVNIGVQFMNQELIDSSLKYFGLSRETAMKINDQRVLGYAEINLSNIHHKQENFDEGIRAARAAQIAFNSSGNTAMEQMGFLTEARHLISKGDFRQAINISRNLT